MEWLDARSADWPLVADERVIRDIARGFQGQQAQLDVSGLLLGVAIFVLFFLGIWALSRWVSRKDRRRGYYSPRALFRALCQAHQLDHVDRRLLAQLARWHHLDQPSQLFLDPNRFGPEGLPPHLASESERLLALRSILFAASPRPAAGAQSVPAEPASPEPESAEPAPLNASASSARRLGSA